MSRTPEETARLAATVTVETIYGDVGISAKVAMGAARARFHGSDHPRLHALACLAADLAEARAEVAALRDHLAALRADAALLAEWRKWREERRAAKVRAYSLESEILRGDALRAVWNRLAVARAAVRAIEARMLATATAEEVGRG